MGLKDTLQKPPYQIWMDLKTRDEVTKKSFDKDIFFDFVSKFLLVHFLCFERILLFANESHCRDAIHGIGVFLYPSLIYTHERINLLLFPNCTGN